MSTATRGSPGADAPQRLDAHHDAARPGRRGSRAPRPGCAGTPRASPRPRRRRARRPGRRARRRRRDRAPAARRRPRPPARSSPCVQQQAAQAQAHLAVARRVGLEHRPGAGRVLALRRAARPARGARPPPRAPPRGRRGTPRRRAAGSPARGARLRLGDVPIGHLQLERRQALAHGGVAGRGGLGPPVQVEAPRRRRRVAAPRARADQGGHVGRRPLERAREGGLRAARAGWRAGARKPEAVSTEGRPGACRRSFASRRSADGASPTSTSSHASRSALACAGVSSPARRRREDVVVGLGHGQRHAPARSPRRPAGAGRRRAARRSLTPGAPGSARRPGRAARRRARRTRRSRRVRARARPRRWPRCRAGRRRRSAAARARAAGRDAPATASTSLWQPFAGAGPRSATAPSWAVLQRAPVRPAGARIGLVQHQELRPLVRADLLQHRRHRRLALLDPVRRGVDHVQQQVRLRHLLERGAERRDQRVRQLLDEADRVDQQQLPAAAQPDLAHQRVERHEELARDDRVARG